MNLSLLNQSLKKKINFKKVFSAQAILIYSINCVFLNYEITDTNLPI